MIEAERSAIGLQVVWVLYFGDGWVGDKGRPVIGEGKPGDWGDLRFVMFGGFRGLPPSAILVYLCLSVVPSLPRRSESGR